LAWVIRKTFCPHGKPVEEDDTTVTAVVKMVGLVSAVPLRLALRASLVVFLPSRYSSLTT
jgi:hypothetical protein